MNKKYSRDIVLQRLFSRTTKGIKLGLERMERAVVLIGNPQESYRVVHVAGTNGKGSVCAYVESVLRTAGFRTGLYTSPHIVNFEERFAVSGSIVPEQEWLDVYAGVEDIVESLDLTFFEAATLVCMELFRRRNVEWAVVETGLGGRLDATNVVTPEISIVTSLSLDHKEYLGDTIADVAREKLGIVKPGVPLVLAHPENPEALRLAQAVCGEKNSQLSVIERRDITDVERTGSGALFTFNGKRYETALSGSYQPLNAACAIKAVQRLGIVSQENTVSGICACRIPGRFQIIRHNSGIVVLDVGHNPSAAEGLAGTLAQVFTERTICVIAGIMSDKEIGSMLKAYSACASAIILTKPDTPRAATLNELKSSMPVSYAGKTLCVDTVGEAVETGFSMGFDVVCITGSFYTVGEAMVSLGIIPYGHLYG